jgi:amino acid transporter
MNESHSNRSLSARADRARRRVTIFLLGREKNPLEKGIFHHLSLIAFFAWVGLGADGLTSSCYGPEEAYLALQGHAHLALWLALATALTVTVIAVSYSQIIRLFPGGGGGYLVATSLLSPTAGVISGCALVVDYVLTIAVSVASGIDALLSFASHADSPLKLPLCLVVIFILVMLNLRGVKESVQALLPIFLLFVATHAILIFGAAIVHGGALPSVVHDSVSGTRDSLRSIGFWATLFIFLRAFSMGAGTYTGIEAVSNGLPVLREPRVRTGQRTMVYMALSLALTAGGILVGYRLFDVKQVAGQTLNASLIHGFADTWNSGPVPWGTIFVALTLLSEGLLLFVAAQTGFVDGPRVLASMAVDKWVPTRFANMSSRLVTANGILLMAVAAGLALIYTKAAVKTLVIMYSINVFVTFSLSQLGMVRHWWQVGRGDSRAHHHSGDHEIATQGDTGERSWFGRLLLNGAGLVISVTILAVTVILKFTHGGWVTVVVTGSFVGLAFLIRHHYRRVGYVLQLLNLVGPDLADGLTEPPRHPEGRVVAVFVNRYDGLGLRTIGRVRQLLGVQIRRLIFLSVAQVDSKEFRSEEKVRALRETREKDLQRYLQLARGMGIEAEQHLSVGTDVVEELEKLALSVAETHESVLFVAGQIVFERETLATRLLHNEVAFALQKRLTFRGLDLLVLPVTIPDEENS